MPGLGYLLKYFVFEKRLFLKELFLDEAHFNAYI